ncbi:MAG: hypothetical protein ACREUG_08195, partial [Steroidobacteraceae bacterium]
MAACLIGCAVVAAARPGAEHRRPDHGKRAEAEAQLQAVQAEIVRTRAQASRARAAADRMTRDLKRAELSVGAARDALSGLAAQRTQHA